MDNMRKQQKNLISRQSIIDAAQEVFFEKGYDMATVDEIAERAQYSKRTVYQYISSKEEMYDEVAIRAYIEFSGTLSSATGETAMQHMLNLIHKAYEFASTKFSILNVMLTYHIRKIGFDPNKELHKRIIELDREILKTMSEIIIRGIKSGEFRADINPMSAATFMIASYIGFVDICFNKNHYIEGQLNIMPDKIFNEMQLVLKLYLEK